MAGYPPLILQRAFYDIHEKFAPALEEAAPDSGTIQA
jgi:hypothetical protein